MLLYSTALVLVWLKFVDSRETSLNHCSGRFWSENSHYPPFFDIIWLSLEIIQYFRGFLDNTWIILT
jgi:hypothetical protein